ncbi:MAG: Bug family tripartite tricarboxylate transporter substrate binding protein [Lautropia sp.]
MTSDSCQLLTVLSASREHPPPDALAEPAIAPPPDRGDLMPMSTPRPAPCRFPAPTRRAAAATRLAVGALAIAGACLGSAGAAIAADAYPTRAVKIIAPVNPGGGVDLVARTVAERLGKVLEQSIVVENLSGGGGVIGSQAAARAAPDGYTLMLGYVGTHGTNPAVRKLPYDAVKDFTPIAMIAGTPNVLVVPSALPVTDIKQFVATMKANGQTASYGSAGQGTLTHLAMEQLKVAAGLDIVHVAYRGIGPAIVDVLGGQTQAMMPGLAAALPHIRAGKMRPIAVTGLKRHASLPDVPTLEELGYKGFDGVQWYGIVAPAGVPAPIVEKLNGAINTLLADPGLSEKLQVEALTTMPMSPAQFGQYIRDDIAKWTKVATERNIRLDK